MKNRSDYFGKKKNSGSLKLRAVLASSLFFLVAGSLPLCAQSDAAAESVSHFGNPLWYIFGTMAILVGGGLYSIFNAKRVLERNGKSLDFSLLSARWMATHGKMVGAIILIIILAAIIWATHF